MITDIVSVHQNGSGSFSVDLKTRYVILDKDGYKVCATDVLIKLWHIITKMPTYNLIVHKHGIPISAYG